jgi:hypothetical protein
MLLVIYNEVNKLLQNHYVNKYIVGLLWYTESASSAASQKWIPSPCPCMEVIEISATDTVHLVPTNKHVQGLGLI